MTVKGWAVRSRRLFLWGAFCLCLGVWTWLRLLDPTGWWMDALLFVAVGIQLVLVATQPRRR